MLFYKNKDIFSKLVKGLLFSKSSWFSLHLQPVQIFGRDFTQRNEQAGFFFLVWSVDPHK